MLYLVIVLLVVTVGVSIFLLKNRHDAFEKKIQDTYSSKNIVFLDKVVFLAAQESKGLSQTQGLGYLILTDRHLYFEMQPIDRTIDIPLESITTVGETYRMGGKSTGKLWLKVEYTIEGNSDALALSVKNIDDWKSKLSNAIKNIA